MSKNELVKELVDIKIMWWSIVENKEYDLEQKEQLHKILWKSDKKSITNQIECYKSRMNNAKVKLGVC